MKTMMGLTVALWISVGCAGAPDASGPEGPVSRTELSEESARERAIDAARSAGYDPARYEITSVERDGARWSVRFEIPPPTPPGGHFLVHVDAESGEAQLMHGE